MYDQSEYQPNSNHLIKFECPRLSSIYCILFIFDHVVFIIVLLLMRLIGKYICYELILQVHKVEDFRKRILRIAIG